jgi:hypothetical protein
MNLCLNCKRNHELNERDHSFIHSKVNSFRLILEKKGFYLNHNIHVSDVNMGFNVDIDINSESNFYQRFYEFIRTSTFIEFSKRSYFHYECQQKLNEYVPNFIRKSLIFRLLSFVFNYLFTIIF